MVGRKCGFCILGVFQKVFCFQIRRVRRKASAVGDRGVAADLRGRGVGPVAVERRSLRPGAVHAGGLARPDRRQMGGRPLPGRTPLRVYHNRSGQCSTTPNISIGKWFKLEHLFYWCNTRNRHYVELMQRLA